MYFGMSEKGKVNKKSHILSIELEYVKKKVFFYRDHWSLTPVRKKNT